MSDETAAATEERIKAIERHIAEYAARQQALREWAAANQAVPLGRIAALLIAEDDKSEDLSGGEGPEYYGGLGFALNAIMDEVVPPAPQVVVTSVGSGGSCGGSVDTIRYQPG